MAVTVVQSAAQGGVSATHAVTLDTPAAAAGSLLVAVVAARSGGSDWTNPAGWTRSLDGDQSGGRAAIFTKTATGGETGFSATYSTTDEYAAWLVELAGADAPDASGAGLVANGSTTVAATTSGATATAEGYGIAYVALNQEATSGFAWDSGFAESALVRAGAGTLGQTLDVGVKALTAQGVVSTTATWTGGERGGWGILTVTAAAGGTPEPVTGTGSATAQPGQASGAGTATVAGAGSATAPTGTGAGAGQASVTGTGTADATPATANGAGSTAVTGDAAATAPSGTAAGTGTATSPGGGTGHAVAPAGQASGAGTTGVSGSGDATAPAGSGDGAGTLAVDGSGQAAGTPATADGTGGLEVTGAGDATAPAGEAAGDGATSGEPTPTRDVTFLRFTEHQRLVTFTERERVTFTEHQRQITMGATMRLHPSGREYYDPDPQTDPPLTAWEASFDGTTWVTATAHPDTGRPVWLVAGPDADPGTATVLAKTTDPVVRAVDNPEVIVRGAPRITVSAY